MRPLAQRVLTIQWRRLAMGESEGFVGHDRAEEGVRLVQDAEGVLDGLLQRPAFPGRGELPFQPAPDVGGRDRVGELQIFVRKERGQAGLVRVGQGGQLEDVVAEQPDPAGVVRLVFEQVRADVDGRGVAEQRGRVQAVEEREQRALALVATGTLRT